MISLCLVRARVKIMALPFRCTPSDIVPVKYFEGIVCGFASLTIFYFAVFFFFFLYARQFTI